MNVADTLKEYDAMFGVKPIGEIEAFLDRKVGEARSERDREALLALLNESVGLARNMRLREKALALCSELLELAGTLESMDAAQYATVLLNVGTAYSVFGRYEGAEALFKEAEGLLNASPAENGYRLASLYNNWSMLYVQQERFADSVAMQKKALALIDGFEGMAEEKATSRSNIASILLRQYEAERESALLDEAERLLDESMAIYRQDSCQTFHYGTALITKGDLLTAKKDYAGAVAAYTGAMGELEQYLGSGSAQYEAARALRERAKALAEEAGT